MPYVKKSLRLLDIAQRLKGRAYTVEELAELYGVSRRSICRDLQDLAGEPVYAPLVAKRYWRLLNLDEPEA